MNALERLEDFAYNSGIDIIEYPTYRTNVKGCCTTINGKTVFLNTASIKDDAEQRCVLAEEIGHLETNSLLPVETYINPAFAKWTKQKNEIRAKRWAVEELLPFDRLNAAIMLGKTGFWELSEFLNLPVWFVEMAVEMYQRKGELQSIEFACSN